LFVGVVAVLSDEGGEVGIGFSQFCGLDEIGEAEYGSGGF